MNFTLRWVALRAPQTSVDRGRPERRHCLDLVEDLLPLPTVPVQFHNHAGRQIRFVGQELVGLPAHRIEVGDDSQRDPLAGHHPTVRLDAVIAGIVPVPVPIADPVVRIQFRNVGQPVRQAAVYGLDQPVVEIAQQLTAPTTAQGAEVVGVRRGARETQPMLLEKTPAAGRGLQDTVDAQVDEIQVREFRTGTGMRTVRHQGGDGLEEGVVHGAGIRGSSHRGRFWGTSTPSSLFLGLIRLSTAFSKAWNPRGTLAMSTRGRPAPSPLCHPHTCAPSRFTHTDPRG